MKIKYRKFGMLDLWMLHHYDEDPEGFDREFEELGFPPIEVMQSWRLNIPHNLK